MADYIWVVVRGATFSAELTELNRVQRALQFMEEMAPREESITVLPVAVIAT